MLWYLSALRVYGDGASFEAPKFYSVTAWRWGRQNRLQPSDNIFYNYKLQLHHFWSLHTTMLICTALYAPSALPVAPCQRRQRLRSVVSLTKVNNKYNLLNIIHILDVSLTTEHLKVGLEKNCNIDVWN